jgi:RNA polymerase sigma-70 factor (ECF subfamily)
MEERERVAERFETHRSRLHAVAYRMLGSSGEAEDAVQETWLRLARAEVGQIDNLGGWLTTVLSRICLDALRVRASRREELVGDGSSDDADLGQDVDPEREAVLVDSVGRALLVMMDRLGPDERVAFVLHDLFAVPFDEIAPIVRRTTPTTKKLASRARQRLQGASSVPAPELARHRHLVEAFLAASRAGDLEAILTVLAPDVVRRADPAALPSGRAREVRGARTVAEEIAVFGANARFAAPALVGGDVGIVVAPYGRLRAALVVTVDGDRIAAYELVADPERLRALELAVLDG